MKYYVYILESLKNGRYYIGYTNNLEERLKRHNDCRTKGNKYYAPFELIYKEEYDNSDEARKREYYIKKQKSRKFIQGLIVKSVSVK
jgi:putative endonuclease